MKVAMEKLMRTKRVMTPWKMGTAYQCFSRMYHLTHLNKSLRIIQQKEWNAKLNLREVEEQGCGAQ